MNIICIKKNEYGFSLGHKYEAFFDGDGYNEPKHLMCKTDEGEEVIIVNGMYNNYSYFNEFFIFEK